MKEVDLEFGLLSATFQMICEEIKKKDGYSKGRAFSPLDLPLDLVAETDILQRCEERARGMIGAYEFIPINEYGEKCFRDLRHPDKPQIKWVTECFEQYINQQKRLGLFREMLGEGTRNAEGIKLFSDSLTDYYALWAFYYFKFGVGLYSYHPAEAFDFIRESINSIEAYCKRKGKGIYNNKIREIKHKINSSKGGRKKSDNSKLVRDELVIFVKTINAAIKNEHKIKNDSDVIKYSLEHIIEFLNSKGIDWNISYNDSDKRKLYDKISSWYVSGKYPEVKKAIDSVLR